MNCELKEDIIDIEHALCVKLRPTFLAISHTEDEEEIHIIISTLAFSSMTIQERVNSVFNLLSSCLPDIINRRLLVIQAYDGTEVEEILENIFK